jgi:hypothetical protein
MALQVNLAQINSAAKGNSDLRETLTSLHLAVQSLYAGATAPLQKVDAKPTPNLGPPAQCGLSVVGANGSFTVTITLPQQASGSAAPGNPMNAPIYQELSSSPAANFATGLVKYPVGTGTSYVFPNPGATLYWRLRSSYNQQNWNNYVVLPGAVAAGLQTSAATQPNVSLNQSNFATVDSVAAGGTATVRIYGSGGVNTAWTSILGNSSKVIPAGTILNVAYGTTGFVVWDGSKYQLKPSLTQTFPDTWIPVGKVSVISNGSGLVLPVIHLVLGAGGAVIAWNVVSGGNDLTADVSLAIVTSTGSGAAPGAQVISGGVLQSIAPGNPGANYAGGDTVNVSGGVSGGAVGGGGPTGQNTGRFYGGTT